ncbi:putative transporter domain protein, partial [Vibrio parahaemolyticus V-223/04]
MVAVFDINIENIAVISIRPNMTNLGFCPNG